MLINSHTHQASPYPYVYAPTLEDLGKLQTLSHRYWTWGLHPWWVEQLEVDKVLNFLANNIAAQGLIGMGEIGLDKFYKSDFKKQQQAFEKQVRFAINHNIDLLIIHAVKTHNEVATTLKDSGFQGRILLHDFSANPDVLRMYEGLDYFLGIGAKLLNPKTKLPEYFLEYPVDRIVHETDDSDSELAEIYREACQITGDEPTEWQIQVGENNTRLFKTLFPI
jgi:TatD DNase family protein